MKKSDEHVVRTMSLTSIALTFPFKVIPVAFWEYFLSTNKMRTASQMNWLKGDDVPKGNFMTDWIPLRKKVRASYKYGCTMLYSVAWILRKVSVDLRIGQTDTSHVLLEVISTSLSLATLTCAPD